MSAAVGAVLNIPRATAMSTTSARPSHRTAPAAYDAQIPGLSPSIHTRASMRRTPSTNSTASGRAADTEGSIARHEPAGTSTSTLTVPADSASSSVEVPYSHVPRIDREDHVSTRVIVDVREPFTTS